HADLPILTLIVLGIARFIREQIWALVLGGVVFVFAMTQWLRSTSGRHWGDAIVLKIPIIGGIFRRFAISQFTRSLATLLGGGTPLVPALENAADAVGNSYVSRKIREVVPRVREGGELWRALESTQLLTSLTIEMVKVGE